MDEPLVVFRGAGGAPAVFADRCPHRNYPLSRGRVTSEGTIECGYHGWRFDGCGSCVAIPGLPEGMATGAVARNVSTHTTVERDGIVWFWGTADEEPTRLPFALPTVPATGSGTAVLRCDLDATLHAALENSLDVPHTAFLHGGLFRGGARHTVTARRRALPDGVEVEYVGEPARMGPLRLPGGAERTFDHWDRFFLPSIAQIEYAVDRWFRIFNTVVHLPLSAHRTRAWFIVQYWSRLPAALVRPVIHLRGRQILRQDALALAGQSATVQSFGGEHFASTDLDVLGNAIWRLLRQAERADTGGGGNDHIGDWNGHGDDAEPVERSMTFDV
jgi:phenylpropionate dioxygenase-like ring-hydroxylating dioxygenase large terminal subunit